MLRRKAEQAAAANKRLKEALAKQQNVAEERAKSQERQAGTMQERMKVQQSHVSFAKIPVSRVPTGTGNPGKPGKMRQLFPVRENSGNFEKILKSQGKVREF